MGLKNKHHYLHSRIDDRIGMNYNIDEKRSEKFEYTRDGRRNKRYR